jgi:hypothetical protein
VEVAVVPAAPHHPSISEEQNTEESLQLLRADTHFYLLAKRLHALRMAGTLILALLAPVILFWKPGWGDFVGALAGAWVLVARTILLWLEDRFVKTAVTIQEEFDVRVFSLTWNEGLAGAKAAPEDVHDAARKIHGKKAARLRDWYPEADEAPWPLNVVLCQRSSAVWGRRGHYWYALLVLGLGVSWFIAGLVMATAAHVTVAEYLVKVFLPSQPAFLDTIDLSRGHYHQAQAKEAVEQATTDLWNRGVQHPGSVSEQDCRDVQDQAYALRRNGTQIPQLIYRIRRRQDEAAMRAAAARLLGALPRQGQTETA